MAPNNPCWAYPNNQTFNIARLRLACVVHIFVGCAKGVRCAVLSVVKSLRLALCVPNFGCSFTLFSPVSHLISVNRQGSGSGGLGLVAADEAVVAPSTMDAAFEEQLKDGAEAFEFQAEVFACAE